MKISDYNPTTIHNVIVRNEDGRRLFVASSTIEPLAWKQAIDWLLDHTRDRRDEMGSTANDEEWLRTLIDNGFFDIELNRRAQLPKKGK